MLLSTLHLLFMLLCCFTHLSLFNLFKTLFIGSFNLKLYIVVYLGAVFEYLCMDLPGSKPIFPVLGQ